jgi:hypothetical protein
MSEKDLVGVGCVPMMEFLQQHPQECEACLVAPIVPWYRELVQDRPECLAKLNGLDPNGVTAADIIRALDEVKALVEPDLQAKLRELDCAVQEAVLEAEKGRR